MEQLSLENTKATMIALEKSEGIQSAITYACSVFSKNENKAWKFVEMGLKAIYDHSKCPDLLTASLKTYNLRFVTFVCLTYKQDLQDMPNLRRKIARCSSEHEKRYIFDDYMKDHKSAVTNYCTHLLQLKQRRGTVSFDKVINYAQANLQLEAVYDILHQHHISIPYLCIKVANYLEFMNNKCKAAEVYAEVNEFEKALTLYSSIGKWKEALYIIHKMNIPQYERDQRREVLAFHLANMGIFDGAANIYTDLKWYQKAVRFHVQALSFTDAVALTNAFCPQMRNFVYSNFNEYLLLLLGQCIRSKSFIVYFTRRVEYIWQRRIEASKGFAIQEQSGMLDEDAALIQVIHNKISEVCNLKAAIDEVVSILRNHKDEVRANIFQSLFDEMCAFCRVCARRIWCPHTNEVVNAARANLNNIDRKYHYPPMIPTTSS